MNTKVGVGLVLTILAGVAWFLAAPTQLGGDTTYVTTHGDSMEPGFTTGDLAVLRPARSYNIGDIAAYRSKSLKAVVMHRIVSAENGRYTLKGDNNSFLDPEKPVRTDFIGTLTVRVPQGGTWLKRATSSPVLAAMAFLIAAGGGTTAAMTRRQRRKQRTTMKAPPLPPALNHLPRALRTAAAAVVVLAMASAALGLVSWTRPLMSTAQGAPVETTSTMKFSYRTTVPQSAAYDGTVVTDPQPVFRSLADEVEVAFQYENEVPVSDAIVRTTAELSTANGWRSSVPLGTAETFSGTRHAGSVALQLSDLQARADAAAEAIGDEPPGDVSVTIVPAVTANGEDFRPELPFTLSATALRLVGEEPELTVSHSGASDQPVGEQPSMLTFFGRSITVQQARVSAAGGFGAAAVAALVVVLLAARARRTSEADGINCRYPQLLLPVDPMVLPAGRPVVEVPQIAALARLAERYGLFVMHWERGGRHTYVVLDEGATYRYRTSQPPVADRPLAQDSAVV